jgi:hypothetical protein
MLIDKSSYHTCRLRELIKVNMHERIKIPCLTRNLNHASLKATGGLMDHALTNKSPRFTRDPEVE